MRVFCLTLLLLLSVFSLKAQEYRHWENHFFLGQGGIVDFKDGSSEGGMSFVAGYGLSYRLSPRWSVMSGVTMRLVGETLPAESFDGYDYDVFSFLDVPLLLRYHTGIGKRSWVFCIGPVLSYCMRNETYYVDADPRSPLNDLLKCKNFSLGLQPTISYQFVRHFSVGLDSFICLTNLRRQYDIVSGRLFIHSFTVRMAFNF